MLRRPALKALVCWLALSPCPASAGPKDPIPEDTAITMQRGNCEGGCPIYRVLIFANGDVIWQGRGRVLKLGVVLSRVEWAQLRGLLDEFLSIDYLHLQDIYGNRGGGCQSTKAYMPMVMTSLITGGSSKAISHHDGCVSEISDRLTAIENNIDKVAGTARWISGSSPPKSHH